MEGDSQEPGDATKAPASDEEPKIKLTYFRGIPFPGPPFPTEILEDVVELKPDPTDIFVVTYPKCGTTWMQFIVWEIVHQGAPPPGPNKMMSIHFPFLELTGVDKLHELQRPRLMKTHLPFQLQPYHPLAKYVYVVRNPWDCCVSYYHHTNVEFSEDNKLPFENFFDHFIQGKLPFGDYFDHVLSWYAHINDPNVLFLTYEDMSADRKGTMLKVAKFLGDCYYNVLANDEQVLNNCLKHTEFKYMKDMGMFIPKQLINADKSKQPDKNALKLMMEEMGSVDKDNVDREKFKEWEFFRKGTVGDWKNYFTEDHIRKFNDYIKSKVTDTDIEELKILLCQDELKT